MPFKRPSLGEIYTALQADIRSRLPELNPTRRSVSGVLARVFSGAIHGLYGYLDFSHRQLFADTADAEHLERHAAVWGLARKAATLAIGTATVTGAEGSVIPVGTVLQSVSGLRFVVDAEVRIIGKASSDNDVNSAVLSLTSETTGDDGNLADGTALTLTSPITGVDPEATAKDFTGGGEVESDASLRNRLLLRVRRPPQGGAAHDYENWALFREAHGVDVTRVWVSSGDMGDGTVSVRFMVDSASGIPTAADVETLQKYIDSVRPVTAHVFVLAPIALPVTFEISNLLPDTSAVRATIEAELRDVISRTLSPGGTLLMSQLREAISLASGEVDHTLVSPTENLVAPSGHVFTFGRLEVQS